MHYFIQVMAPPEEKLPGAHYLILLVRPPSRPVNASPVSRLVTIRTVIGVMPLLATLEAHNFV